MHRLLAPILSPRWVIAEMVLAILLVVAGLLLNGTLHTFTVAHVTLIQFGDTIIVGRPGGVVIPAIRIWSLGIVLALPGLGWALWFLTHADSRKST